MIILVHRTMLHAFFARDDGGKAHRPDRQHILTSTARGHPIKSGASVRRVKTAANAFGAIFVHMGETRIGARIGDRGVVHGVLDRLTQRVVVIVPDMRVFLNHFLDRHNVSPLPGVVLEEGIVPI